MHSEYQQSGYMDQYLQTDQKGDCRIQFEVGKEIVMEHFKDRLIVQDLLGYFLELFIFYCILLLLGLKNGTLVSQIHTMLVDRIDSRSNHYFRVHRMIYICILISMDHMCIVY